MRSTVFLGLVCLFSTSAQSEPAKAYFDCDTPAGHYSAFNLEIKDRAVLEGELDFVEYREHKSNPSVGTIQFSEVGAGKIAAVQFVKPSKEADKLQISFVNLTDGKQTWTKITDVSSVGGIIFRFEIAPEGPALLTINGNQFTIEATKLGANRLGIGCGTAQVKYKNLLLPR